MCICACVHMSVCTCAHNLLDSAQKLEDGHDVCCVCVCMYICGVYLACVYSVGAVRQSSGMRLDGPVGVGIAWYRLSRLVLLGCTALMRANSPKHPSGCLQFVQMGERMEEGGRWDVCRRRPGRGKMGCM